jgi:putative transposase
MFIGHSQIAAFVLHRNHADKPAPLYGAGYSHFITTSCFQRRLLLGTPRSRDLFLEVMEEIRQRHQFVVVGYVVMPEHVHFLFTEPERGNPSLVLAALKQDFAHRLLRELRATARAQANALWSTPVAVGHIWQRRFYDFVVFTEKKRVEKLRYMHRNPKAWRQWASTTRN